MSAVARLARLVIPRPRATNASRSASVIPSERLTGRSMDSWTRDARHYVREHPLQAIALTIGLGFVLGKILGRD